MGDVGSVPQRRCGIVRETSEGPCRVHVGDVGGQMGEVSGALWETLEEIWERSEGVIGRLWATCGRPFGDFVRRFRRSMVDRGRPLHAPLTDLWETLVVIKFGIFLSITH